MTYKDKAHRFWTYPKDSTDGPILSWGGDEYGNSTIVLRLPQGRALIVAWNIPLRRELEPFEGYMEYGWVKPDGGSEAPCDNPLPGSYEDFLRPIDLPGGDWVRVRREVMYGHWEAVSDEEADDMRERYERWKAS